MKRKDWEKEVGYKKPRSCANCEFGAVYGYFGTSIVCGKSEKSYEVKLWAICNQWKREK